MGKMAALKNLRLKVQELTEIIDELSEPLLQDQSLLPTIYDSYKRFFARRGNEAEAHTVRNRKKFLMIVLYLYSPASLVGGRMCIGLRKKISDLFGLSTSTPISDNCAGLMVQYYAYPDFHNDVNAIYSEVVAVIPELQDAD